MADQTWTVARIDRALGEALRAQFAAEVAATPAHRVQEVYTKWIAVAEEREQAGEPPVTPS